MSDEGGGGDRQPIPDRPTIHRPTGGAFSGGAYYQSNKVVAYLLQRSTLQGCVDVSQLKKLYDDGSFPKADYREFCQLIGFKVQVLKAMFPDPEPEPPAEPSE